MEIPDIPEQDWKIVENDLDWNVTAEDIDWESANVLELPEGVMLKILNRNEAEGRLDGFQKFPEGYIEPEHTHEAAHAVLVVDGTIDLHGRLLTAGDYFYGQKEPHGPMEYSNPHGDGEYGCIVFISYVGGSPAHSWDEDPNE